MKKKSLSEEIEEFIELWDAPAITKMLSYIIELHKIFDVDVEDEIYDKFDEEDEDQYQKRIDMIEEKQNKRLVEAAFLISWFSEFYSGKLAATNSKFKGLWERMKKVSEEMKS